MRPVDAATLALWQAIRTVEAPEWTARYHASDSRGKAFGGRCMVTLDDGSVIEADIAVADAHPHGARPFARGDYIRKFRLLADDVISAVEQDRFLTLVERLPELTATDLPGPNAVVDDAQLTAILPRGII